jgi:uncharacterized membrane protein YfcA
MVLGIVIGFYDGFFGPGTGNFWVLALMVWGGFHMTRATAYTKVMNFTSNIVALIVFAIGGNIRYELGLLMALGQISGARIGAGMVFKIWCSIYSSRVYFCGNCSRHCVVYS